MKNHLLIQMITVPNMVILIQRINGVKFGQMIVKKFVPNVIKDIF